MLFPNLKKIIVRPPSIFKVFQLGGKWALSPLFYLVHLTLACNSRCPFCYQNDPAFDAARKDFLKLDDFKEILNQAKSFIFKRPLIYFFGGEPLLHPRFAEFLELAEKSHFPCALTTNGILLGKYRSQICGAENLDQITVSLQGVDKVHNQIVGRDGVFRDIISNIRQIKQATPRKIINIASVIIGENQGQLFELASFLDRALGKGIGALIFRYPMTNEDLYWLEDCHFQEIIQKIKKTKFSFPVFFAAEDWSRVSSSASLFHGNCYLPWLGLGILPNFDVTSGGSVLTCSRIVGNLKEKTLKEIWNGQEIKKLRKQILRQGLPFSCRGCCHARLYF